MVQNFPQNRLNIFQNNRIISKKQICDKKKSFFSPLQTIEQKKFIPNNRKYIKARFISFKNYKSFLSTALFEHYNRFLSIFHLVTILKYISKSNMDQNFSQNHMNILQNNRFIFQKTNL